MQTSLVDLFVADLESHSTNRGMLVLVGVDYVKLFNILYSIMDYCLSILHVFCCRSMARNNQPTPFALRSILEKEKLSGTNCSDWIRNLRIVLRAERKESVLDTPIPDEPLDTDTAAIRTAYKRASDESLEVGCLMLACMEPDLQKQFDGQEAYDMIIALKDMFQT